MHHKLPEAFIERIQKQFPENYETFLNSINEPPFTSIRYHPKKNVSHPSGNIPWCCYGRYLDKRPVFTLDPAFHAGYYYVQESSSMFVQHVWLEICKSFYPKRILDVSAAPGGKSTLITSLLNPDQYLVANEIIEKRNYILRENIDKWGCPNVVVTQNNSREYRKLGAFFDCILVDAPCSGEGLFRKDPNAVKEWSIKATKKCSVRQFQILEDVWDSLVPGGFLIYSTCTYNPLENEELIYKFAEKKEVENIKISIPDSWPIEKVNYNEIEGYAFYPHKTKGEGFFCAVLRKKGDFRISKTSQLTKMMKTDYVRKYLDLSEEPFLVDFSFQNDVYATSAPILADLIALKQHLYIKQVGIRMIQKTQKGEIFSHSLSYIINLKKENFQILSLSEKEALEYLKGQFMLDQTLLQDNYLVCTKNIPLGFFQKKEGNWFSSLPPSQKIKMNIV